MDLTRDSFARVSLGCALVLAATATLAQYKVVAPDGSVFVADGYCNNRIVRYDAAGRFSAYWEMGKQGNGIDCRVGWPELLFRGAAEFAS